MKIKIKIKNKNNKSRTKFKFGPQIAKSARKEQIDGISFITGHNRTLLADSMGSGKTLQTIGAIQNILEVKNNAKILVITPSSLGSHWVAEFNKWAPEIKKVLIYSGLQLIDYSAYNVFIISYGLILPGRAKYTEILQIRWDFIIADESHVFRNRETLTSMYIAPILERVNKVLLISGTPQTSRPEQLYVQYNILFPGEMTFEQFAITFCNGRIDSRTGKIIARDYSNLDLLNKKLSTVMLRRDDKTMKPDLMRIKVSFQVQKTPIYLSLQAKLASLVSSPVAAGDKTREITDIVSRLYMETGIIKSGSMQIMSFIINLVRKNYVTTGHKTLIFAHHDIVRERMAAALKYAGIRYNSIDGKVPGPLRLSLVNEVADMKSPVIASVCSITVGGTGLSFVPGVNVVIFLEYTWNISDQLQAEARIARYGANVPTVYAYYIHCGALYDRRLLMNLKEKYLVNRQSIDAEENGPGFVMSREIEYKPGTFSFENYEKDIGRIELEDINNLQKELGILGNKISNKEIKDLDKAINLASLNLDISKDEYEQ